MPVARTMVLDARIKGAVPAAHLVARTPCRAMSVPSSSAGPEGPIEGPAGVKVLVPRSPQRSQNWETGFSTSSVHILHPEEEAATAFIGPAIHSPTTSAHRLPDSISQNSLQLHIIIWT